MYAMTDGVVNHGMPDMPLHLCPMEPAKETMGQRITRLREAKGLSVAELAERVGVKRASVYQWETDVSPNIRPVNFVRLLEELGTDAYYLLWGPERRDPKGSGRTPPNLSDTGRFRRRRG
jgi:transcriptional regulator with XRE-family HTH domain